MVSPAKMRIEVLLLVVDLDLNDHYSGERTSTASSGRWPPLIGRPLAGLFT